MAFGHERLLPSASPGAGFSVAKTHYQHDTAPNHRAGTCQVHQNPADIRPWCTSEAVVNKTKFIFDTSAILAQPEILSRVSSQKVLIPTTVLEELVGRVAGNRLGSLLEQAISKGAEIPASPHVDSKLVFELNRAKLTGADVEIAMLANTLSAESGSQNIVVVTMDIALAQWLTQRNLKVMAPRDFLSKTADEGSDDEVRNTARLLNRQQAWTIFASVLSGALVSFAFQHAHDIYGFAQEYLSIPTACLFLFAVGVAAYWWRQRMRLSYGFSETGVGMVLTYGATTTVVSASTLTMPSILQVTAGLYVVVRGLDNIGKGCQGTRAEPYWTKLFGKA